MFVKHLALYSTLNKWHNYHIVMIIVTAFKQFLFNIISNFPNSCLKYIHIHHSSHILPILFIQNKDDSIGSNYYMWRKTMWWEIWTECQENLSPVVWVGLKTSQPSLLLPPFCAVGGLWETHIKGWGKRHTCVSKNYPSCFIPGGGKWHCAGDGMWSRPWSKTCFYLPSPH